MGVDIPVIGARSALWIFAEIHLFFAAFILGAPIFVVICEYLGLRLRDERYERLAKETMKVTVLAYSFTAITGTVFAFILMMSFTTFAGFIFQKFAPVWGAYILLILVETAVMYLYWYSWEPFKNRKGLHISIGVLLNILGTVVLFLINAVGSYMLTPPAREAGLWSIVNNPSWSGLNLHRFIANITFGGFVVALFAAFMFLYSRNEEDKAFYDWMGYTGNLIGVGTLMMLPLAGYIYAKELFHYSPSISTFLMGDALAPFFVLQGLLVMMLFAGANLYMWFSINRIEGAGRLLRYRTPIVTGLVGLGGLWMVPANMLPDIVTPIPDGVDPASVLMPQGWTLLALMAPKAIAVTGILLITFFTYMIYLRALSTGSIRWGSAPVQSQYALIAVAAVAVYLMGFMGSIRELARRDWHVFNRMSDTSPYWFTSPLWYTSIMTAIVTIIFFTLVAFLFWIGFLLGREETAKT